MALLHKNADTGYWTELGGGAFIDHVHDPRSCAGRGCAIHDHPSDHRLKDAPLNWRTDRNILERVCAHGVGHDDFDAVEYTRSVGGNKGTHGCDGCC